MAEETKEAEGTEVEASKSGLLKALLIPLAVGLVCGGIGFAIPMALPSLVGGEGASTAEPELEPLFLPFGNIVVNLDEGRLSRYLSVTITVQISAAAEEEVALTELMEKRRPILTSWLLGYIADMSMDDIRGTAGQNRLRREINDQFNWVLFPNGEQRIEDVLFEEFNVQ